MSLQELGICTLSGRLRIGTTDNDQQYDQIKKLLDVPVEEWGIDYEGPIREDLIGTVEVPETSCPLNEQDLQQFLDVIDTGKI